MRACNSYVYILPQYVITFLNAHTLFSVAPHVMSQSIQFDELKPLILADSRDSKKFKLQSGNSVDVLTVLTIKSNLRNTRVMVDRDVRFA